MFYYCTKHFLLKAQVFLITPPFTQLNTPYPVTAYIKGFLNTKNISAIYSGFRHKSDIEFFSKERTVNIFGSAATNIKQPPKPY